MNGVDKLKDQLKEIVKEYNRAHTKTSKRKIYDKLIKIDNDIEELIK